MKPSTVLLSALLAVSCAAPQPSSSPRRPAEELVGRTAGAAQRCVLIQSDLALRVSDSDRHTLLYGSGRTIWANDLGTQCGLGADDLLISEPLGSYHCRGDLIRSVDRLTRIPGPACILSDFVPYNR